MYIEKMQDSFLNLDQTVAEINDMAEDETLDADQVKSFFIPLFFGADQPAWHGRIPEICRLLCDV